MINEIDTSIFYNMNKLASYDALLYMVMGERGNGKTYAGKEKMIKLWLNKKKKSIYVRRREAEMDKVKDTLFEDIQKNYPNIEIKVKGYQAFIDGELFCYMIPLSVAKNYRSASFPDVDFIFFDEYIPEDLKFLPDEMSKIYSLISTVFRLRRPNMFFSTNAVSYVNPIFEEFNIQPKPTDNFIPVKVYNPSTKKHFISFVVELTKESDYRNVVNATDFAVMTKNTSYGAYAMNNDVLFDTNDFIVEKKPQGFNYFRCAFRVGNQIVGVWSYGASDSGVWIGENYNKNDKCLYTVFNNENFEGWKNIKIDRNNWNLGYIKKCYLEGRCWYKNQSCKRLFMEQISKYL